LILKMKIFLGCPKDNDNDKSEVTEVSAAKPIALVKSLSLTPRPSSKVCGPRGPHGGGRIRGRGRSHSPMKLRHNAPLASVNWGYSLLNHIGKRYSQSPTKDRQNVQESELQGRDEVQTCKSITTVTSDTDHFEVEATLTCAPETREERIKEKDTDEKICVASDSNKDQGFAGDNNSPKTHAMKVLKNFLNRSVNQSIGQYIVGEGAISKSNQVGVGKSFEVQRKCLTSVNQSIGKSLVCEDAISKSYQVGVGMGNNNVEKFPENSLVVKESFDYIALNVVNLADMKREKKLSNTERLQLYSEVMGTLNVISKHVGEHLAGKVVHSKAGKTLTAKLLGASKQTIKRRMPKSLLNQLLNVSRQVGKISIGGMRKGIDSSIKLIEGNLLLHNSEITEKKNLAASVQVNSEVRVPVDSEVQVPVDSEVPVDILNGRIEDILGQHLETPVDYAVQVPVDSEVPVDTLNERIKDILAHFEDPVERNLEVSVQVDSEVQVPVDFTVPVDILNERYKAILSHLEVPVEKTLKVSDQVDSEVAVQPNIEHEDFGLPTSQAAVSDIGLMACLSFYQTVEFLSVLYLKEAVNDAKDECKSEIVCVHENKNIETREAEDEVDESEIEDVKQKYHQSHSGSEIHETLEKTLVVEELRMAEESKHGEPSMNEPLLVEGSKQEEPSVAEESQIVEESKQDKLPSAEKSRNVNEELSRTDNTEEISLFELVYALHTHFDHTELDEVIRRLGEESDAMSESDEDEATVQDEATVIEDLHSSSYSAPKAVVYDGITCLDECFDTLDGVEYCTVVVNTACNPCTSTINIQEHLVDETSMYASKRNTERE